MKIIGHVGNNGLIVEVTRSELAKMAGYTYETEMENVHGGGYHSSAFNVGRDYKVSDIFNRLKDQERVAERLEDCAKSLECMAGLVRSQVSIAELVGPEIQKEPKK